MKEDAELAAQSIGIGSQTLMDFEDTRLKVNAAIAEIEADMPTSFGGFWWSYENNEVVGNLALKSRPKVSSRQGISTSLISALDSRLSDATPEWRSFIELSERDYSYRELQRIQQSTHNSMRSKGMAIESDIDMIEGKVIVTTPEPSLPEVRFQLESVKVDAKTPGAVRVEVGELGVPGHNAYGGTFLNLEGRRDCTSSFVVRKNSNQSIVGPLSAAHCPDRAVDSWMRAYGHSDFTVRLLPQSEDQTGPQDVEWYSFSGSGFSPQPWFTHTVEPKNRSGKQYLRLQRYLRARGLQQIGDPVCSFGFSDYKDCGKIASKNKCPIWVKPCLSTFIVTDYDSGDEGSSGGPVYYSTTAMGVISGRTNGKLVYMPINYASSLGVSVWTIGG